MKNLFLTLPLALSLVAAGRALPATAQSLQRHTLGVKAGAALTGLFGSNVTSGRYRPTYQAGLTADLGMSRTLSFHPEALYTLRKFDSKTEPTLLNRDVTVLEVPLLFRRHHESGAFFEIGPQLAFVLKAEDEAGADVKDTFRPTLVEGAVGLGYERPGGLGFGLRYSASLTRIYKKGGQYDLPTDRQSNARASVLALSVHYAFLRHDAVAGGDGRRPVSQQKRRR